MLAHYVIEPDGKRSMDLLSAKFLGYEPIPIEELIGKKGKTQGNMRDVELDKIKENFPVIKLNFRTKFFGSSKIREE